MGIDYTFDARMFYSFLYHSIEVFLHLKQADMSNRSRCCYRKKEPINKSPNASGKAVITGSYQTSIFE